MNFASPQIRHYAPKDRGLISDTNSHGWPTAVAKVRLQQWLVQEEGFS